MGVIVRVIVDPLANFAACHSAPPRRSPIEPSRTFDPAPGVWPRTNSLQRHHTSRTATGPQVRCLTRDSGACCSRFLDRDGGEDRLSKAGSRSCSVKPMTAPSFRSPVAAAKRHDAAGQFGGESGRENFMGCARRTGARKLARIESPRGKWLNRIDWNVDHKLRSRTPSMNGEFGSGRLQECSDDPHSKPALGVEVKVAR